MSGSRHFGKIGRSGKTGARVREDHSWEMDYPGCVYYNSCTSASKADWGLLVFPSPHNAVYSFL